MKYGLVAVLIALGGSATADEIVPICYGYSCIAQDQIRYSGGQIEKLGQVLNATVDPAAERKILAEVVGQLYAWAGEQSDIKNDRGGNLADGHSPGRMDCIDHSTSTTRLLELIEAYGFLRWHRVSDIEVRNWAFVFPSHYSAVIEEKASAARFVVDSWFVDNGQPAVILPLDEWKKGAGPDV